jgi:ribosome biogenesis GTPase A
MSSDINWFPGHMTKALRSIQEQLKHVDIVIETCDARIPVSSRNPELNSIIAGKKRMVVLNKCDLAEEAKTNEWIAYFREQGIIAIASDASHKKGLDLIRKNAQVLCADLLERAKNKGRIGRPIRAMVVGIPNSGKSTLINALCNRKIAVTGDRPGVTRGFQWAKSDSFLELMDMPGVLWPKLGSRRNQICLTITGAVKPEIVDMTSFAVDGMSLLLEKYPNELCERYKLIKPEEDGFITDSYELFLVAAKNRGCILSGGRIDEERFATLFLDDFRGGRIGRMTLEDAIFEKNGDKI